MYWIPAIFVVLDFISLLLFSDLSRGYNSMFLADKYNNKELEKYVTSNHPLQREIILGLIILLFLEFVYFVICLFYPLWIISIISISIGVIYGIITITRKKPIDEIIRKAKLNNFQTSDVKFDRLLKLNELNDTKRRYKFPIIYILISLKMFVFISIIVFHYNDINLTSQNNRIGYYNDTTTLVGGDDILKTRNQYISTIHVKEIEKYSNGLSKIESVGIDVIHGFEPDNYDVIKSSLKLRFSTLRKTSDIQWLYKK